MRLPSVGIEPLETRVLLTFPAPMTQPDSYGLFDDVLDTSAEGKPKVLANDIDMNGDPMTAQWVSGPSHGSLTLNGNGHFVYTPTLGYAGSDSFVYKVFDGTHTSSNTTVSLTINKPLSTTVSPEDRPSAGVQATGVLGTSTFLGEVQAGQTVGDGYSLSYESLSDPRPVIAIETTYAAAYQPSKFEVQLTFNGVAQTSVWYTASTMNNNVRFAVQADATSLATGRYPWEMKVIGRYTNGDTATNVYSGNAEIVNLNTSNFGDDWTLRELDRLVPQSGGVLLARGDGLTAWFTSGSGGAFTSPVGPFGTVTLVQNGDSTYRLTDKFGNTANFSSAGLLTSRVDRNGNTTSLAYIDADSDSVADELSTITDPWSRVITFAYSSGLLASVTDNASRVTSITTDSQGRVTAITAPDPDGSGSLSAPVTSYGYSGTTRLLTSVTDPLSHATTVAYDFAGRLNSITDAASSTFPFSIWQTRALPNSSTGQGTESNPMSFYVPDNTVATQANGLSGTNSSRFDRFGFLTSFKDALNNTTTWTRNTNGLATQLTQPDPDGSGSLTAPVTSYQYDSAQNLTQVTLPGGATQSWVYSSTLNVPTSATNELSKTTSFTYDSYGNLLTATSPLGYVTTDTYNSRGQVLTVTAPDPDGSGSLTSPVTSFSYDSSGRLTTITNPDSSTQQRGYDSADRVTSQTDELSRVTSIAYDNLNRVTSVTQPDPDGSGSLTSPVTTLAYNAVGNVTSQTDGAPSGSGRVTSFSYDALNRLTQTTLPDPDGSGSLSAPVYAPVYNAAGQVTSTTDALGNVTTYAYNSAGQNTSITQPDPDGSGSLTAPVTSFLYDNLGRRTRITDPLNRQTNFEYSSRNWLTKRTDPDPDGSGSLTSPVTQWANNAAGQLTSITDPLSRVTALAYDNDGRQTSVTLPDPDGSGSLTAPVGKATTFAYDSRSRLTQRTDPDPDGSGSLTSPVTQWAFDAASQLTNTTDPLSRVTSFSYDNLGRQILVTLPDPDGSGSLTAPQRSATFDAVGNVTSQTDPLGNVTSFSYDNLNRLLVRTEPDPDGTGSLSAPVTTFTYNAVGSLTSLTDPLGHVTAFEYDNLNRLKQRTDTDPDGSGSLMSPITLWAYNAASELTSTTDPLGHVTSFSYDNLGRKTLVILPDPDGSGSLTAPQYATTFDAASNVLTQTDPLGKVTTFENDSLSRLTKRTDPDPDGSGSLTSPVTQWAFDAASQLTSTTDPLSRVTSFSYDNLGRQILVTLPDPDGSGSLTVPQQSVTFDAAGNVLTQTDPLGNVTSFTYDNVNRLLVRTEPDPDGSGSLSAPVTSFTYNAVGSLTSLTDPVGNMTTWSLDNLQRATSETNALSATRSWVFDAAGNVTKATDRNGRIREFTFDGVNRLTQEKWKNGETVVNTITNAFDAASQLTTTSDSSAALAFSHDNLGRVTSISNSGTPNVPTVVLANTFDAASRRTGLAATINSTNDFKNTYQYDNLGRMTQVTQQGQSGGNTVADKRVDLTYHANGQFSTLSRYANLTGTQLVATTTYSFDQANRLTSLAHAKGSTTLASYSWTFDAAGRITNATTPDGTATYSYDNDGQLTGADHSVETDETYSYDANGNRTMSGYTTGTNNRLTSDGTSIYTYDSEGNRTRRTNFSTGDYVDYAWDHRNRLTSVTYKTSGGTTTKKVEYTYDTLNRRISKRVDDNGNGTFDRAEYFVYDSAHKTDPNIGVALDDIVLIFVDADGDGSGLSTLNSRLLHGPAIDQVFATESSTNEVLWSLTDHQGTVRDVAKYNSGTDTTTVVNHLKYDSFGKITSQTNSSYQLLHSYTGREWDSDAGLNYYHARWYDPAVGRFLGEAPWGFGGGDANVGRYVGNSPTHFTDPSGLAASSITSAAIPANCVNPLNSAELAAITAFAAAWGAAHPPPSSFSIASIVGNVAAGIAVGAVTTAIVIVAAPAAVTGLVALGATAVVAKAAVSVSLCVVGGVSLVTTTANTVQDYNTGNYNQMAFNLGAVGGGIAVGTLGGGALLVKGLTGSPSPSPKTLNVLAQVINEGKNSFAWVAWLTGKPLPSGGKALPPWSPTYLATGPTPFIGGLTATGLSSSIITGFVPAPLGGPTSAGGTANGVGLVNERAVKL